MTDPNLAIVYGPKEPALWSKTLGNFVDEQANSFGERPCVVFPWQSVRLSYCQLADRSKILAKAMLEMGLRHGDCVGIMAGNCYQYIEVFLGGARIGCPVVVLNNTYTPVELQKAVSRSGEFWASGNVCCSWMLTLSKRASLFLSLLRLVAGTCRGI